MFPRSCPSPRWRLHLWLALILPGVLCAQRPAPEYRTIAHRPNVLLLQPPAPSAVPSHSKVARLLGVSRQLADRGIPYRYGGTSESGMDCSASVQHLFAKLGVVLPRTSEAQANHLAKQGQLFRAAPWESEKTIFSRLQPGDLIFWVRKASPNRVSHVMMYIGPAGDGKVRLWGAQGTGRTGLSGSGVDYFEYRIGSRRKSTLVAYGRPKFP